MKIEQLRKLIQKQIIVEQKKKTKSTKFKGGFSDGVFDSYHFQKYIQDGRPSGYIGASGRSKEKDKIVEEALRKTGLKDDGIAMWLTSGDGRHMMTDGAVMKNMNEFKKHVEEYTKDAFKKVTVWAHPDHRGTLGSSIELHKQIFGEK